MTCLNGLTATTKIYRPAEAQAGWQIMKSGIVAALLFLTAIFQVESTQAQVAPSSAELAQYAGLHAAAASGDVQAIRNLVKKGADLEIRDNAGRTPLHVAAFASSEVAVEALAAAGVNMNALENAAYDIVTIAAVADDVEMLKLALKLGANADNITSPYEGTALIAAAHLGHDEVVSTLINAGAPLDHVNNLGWTALIEVVVLGDGGPRHVESARALLKAGANRKIADRQGVSPLQHAKQSGYGDIVELFHSISE